MRRKKIKSYLIHIVLFLVTLATTTLAGAEWIGIREASITQTILNGFAFSLPFLGILTIHEFGHYFTARYYKVKVSLPYYIPFYLGIMNTIGTLGAFIRMKSRINSRKVIFDIGIAGPLAGFVAALIILTYGFTNLPEPEHIYKIHPEYEKHGLNYADHVYNTDGKDSSAILISVGDNLLFSFFENYVVQDKSKIPNRYEMMHYPFLFAGFLALFFTALNLIPIGQLDGGHILYGLIGYEKQRIVSPVLFSIFVYFAGLSLFRSEIYEGFIPLANWENFLQFAPFYLLFLYIIFSKVSDVFLNNVLIVTVVFTVQFLTALFFPYIKGFDGWLVFAFIIGRFLGVHHPRAAIEEPLDMKRKILGWVSLIIFVLCFTPTPLIIE